MGANYDNLSKTVNKMDGKIDSLHEEFSDIKMMLQKTVSVEHFNKITGEHKAQLDAHTNRIEKLEEANAIEEQSFIKRVSKGFKDRAISITVTLIFLLLMFIGFMAFNSLIKQADTANQKVNILEGELYRALNK